MAAAVLPEGIDLEKHRTMTTTPLPRTESPKDKDKFFLTDGDSPISMQNIQSLVRRIADKFQPEKVVLFGSYAYGNPGPESDVDLLVVMNTSLSSRQQRLRISQAISPRPFPLDIIVRTPEELEQRLKSGDPFLREVISQGRVIYERNSY